jgi:S-layer protein (TIGR01567 family)
VDEISGENDTIRIKYLFLIDDDVMEIETSDTYGVMEVMTASKTIVTLRNNERPLDLDTNTVEQIMGDMYFKTADNAPGDNQIRFYPMVECTEPGTYEMRGNVINLHDATSPELAWNATNFAAFWYDLDDDLMTEELRIDSNVLTSTPTGAGEDRTIDEDSLWYATSPAFQEYELHENEPDPDRDSLTAMEAEYVDYTSQNIGLCVESDRPGGDCGYFIEGWMGEKYVAIDGKADKLTKLLVEFEDDEYMILFTGKKWDLGGGFALELMGINDEGDAAMLQLSKNNVSLYIDCVSVGGGACRHDRVYTYRKDVAGEKNIPIFSCYVDAVFKGDISCVRVMYAFLIDDEVQVIKTRQTYGAMEVMTANSMEIILKNDETAIDLDPGTTKNITENMYFRIVNETSAIRFYPFVERTIGGEEPTPPPATIPATDSDHDGVPDVWDADNSTPSDYWVNSDGIGRKWGDMNGDGELTSADALMILQAAVGKIELG